MVSSEGFDYLVDPVLKLEHRLGHSLVLCPELQVYLVESAVLHVEVILLQLGGDPEALAHLGLVV